MAEKDKIVLELLKAQEEITSGNNKSKYFDNNNNKTYGLVNSSWYEIYMDYIMNDQQNLNGENEIYSVECLPKDIKRNYSKIDSYSYISIPSNFTFVTKEFMSLLSEKFDDQTIKNTIKNYLVEIFIGEECIIMKDKQQMWKYNYIILYDSKTQNINNNIDYILKFEDKLEMNSACEFILQNNIWIYINQLKYSYEDEIKIIFNKKDEQIGYLARNDDSSPKLKMIENNQLGILNNKNSMNNAFYNNFINNNNMNNSNNNNMRQIINMNNMNSMNYMNNMYNSNNMNMYSNGMINNNLINNTTNANNSNINYFLIFIIELKLL